MSPNSRPWKKWIGAAVGALLVLDTLLIVLIWRSGQVAPQERRQERDRLEKQAGQFARDVENAEQIKGHFGEVGKECDRFIAERLLSVSTGYSSVVGDLGEIAAHAGLKTGGVTFRQKGLRDRGVTEVAITASVEGDYPALIHFINGLDRSKNFYLLDGLTLVSASSGKIKLNLELRTYFRS